MDNDLRQSADQLDWQRHEQTLWRFERAWIEDGQPAIADFLADKTAATRQYLLRELIKLDLEYHWKAGNRVRVEDYLHRFPELGDLSAADDLLEEEFLARRHVSQLPDQDEIADRFPDKRAKIERLVDAVASGVEKPYETIVSQADRTPGTHLGGLSGGDSHLRSLGLARGVTIERYVLCEEVGRGGFASVWRAEDTQLSRDVAIKLLRADRIGDQAAVTRMLREARAAARLQHPFIVQVFEVGEFRDCPYIVNEFVPGPTLDKWAGEVKRDQRTVAKVVRDIAFALEHAHRQGIVHRDVKPANILMTSTGEPKVTDFGLAHEEYGAEPTLTRAGDILGTPAFMAPEQARGDVHLIDARTDVYAVGAVLYTLLTGELPFQGTTASVIHAVIHDQPPALRRHDRELDRDLETITLKCLEKDTADRYYSANELGKDLGRYLRNLPILARPARLPERAWKWMRRYPKVAALIAGLLLLAGFLLGTGLQLRRVSFQRDRAQEAERSTQVLLAGSAAGAGLLAMQRGQFEEAIAHLDQSLRLKPDDPADLQLKRIESLVALRRVREADDDLRQLVSAGYPAAHEGRVLMWRAQLALERGHAGIAPEDLLAQALRLDLPAAEKAYAQAMLADTSPDCTQHLAAALQNNPMHHRARRMLITLQIALARFEEAHNEIETARQLYANDVDFVLLDSLTNAALGSLEVARQRIVEVDLSADEQAKWLQFCEDIAYLTQQMPPGWEDSERTKRVVRNYVSNYYRLLEARGIHAPPKIAARFHGLAELLDAWKIGEMPPARLQDKLSDIVEAHPEGSLLVLLGEIKLMRYDVADAAADPVALAGAVARLGDIRDTFQKATDYPGFIRFSKTSALQGLAATALAFAYQLQHDVEQNVNAFLTAVRQLEPAFVSTKNASVFARATLRCNELNLAEMWIDRWAKMTRDETPDWDATQWNIRWHRMLLQQQRGNDVQVVKLCDELIQGRPDEQRAIRARDGALKRIAQVCQDPARARTDGSTGELE